MSGNDQSGLTALHYAALANNVAEVRRLLDMGLPPDSSDRQGFTPLHLAAQQGSKEACELLLEAGAAVDPVNKHGNTPLFVAVFNSRGRGDIIELLRCHGADPRHTNAAGQTPLGLARLIGNFDVAQFFADLADS